MNGVRFILDEMGTLYMWNAKKYSHDDVSDAKGISGVLAFYEGFSGKPHIIIRAFKSDSTQIQNHDVDDFLNHPCMATFKKEIEKGLCTFRIKQVS